MGDAGHDFTMPEDEGVAEDTQNLSVYTANGVDAGRACSLIRTQDLFTSFTPTDDKDATSARTKATTVTTKKLDDEGEIEGQGSVDAVPNDERIKEMTLRDDNQEENGQDVQVDNRHRITYHTNGTRTVVGDITTSASRTFEQPANRGPELTDEAIQKLIKLNMSSHRQNSAINIPDPVACYNSITNIPLISALLPPANAQRALPDSVDPRPRRLSSSTREVSRFFPPTASGSSPHATARSNGEGAPGAVRQRTASGSSWASRPCHPPQRATSFYGSHDSSQAGPASMYENSNQSTHLLPSIQSGFRIPTTPRLMPVAEDHSLSRITSPSRDSDFFRPGEECSTLPAPASAVSSFLDNTGLGIAPLGPRDLPAFPRRATNIESLEKAAEGSEMQRVLSTARPGSSWVTGLTDWRNNGVASQRIGAEDDGPKPIPRPSFISMVGTSNTMMARQAGIHQSHLPRTSRVLRIAGPAAVVREDLLRGLFARYFEYESEGVAVLAEGAVVPPPGKVGGVGVGVPWRVLEWRFASMRAQAHAACQLLQSLYQGVVDVRYAVDPCAGYLVMGEHEAGL